MTWNVLIVDDEPMARNRLQRLLRAEADVRLLPPCVDGRGAVDAIREQRPDLVFLDVQMPEMNGRGRREADARGDLRHRA